MRSFLSLATPMRWFNNHFGELTRSILIPGPIAPSPAPVPVNLDVPSGPARGINSPDSSGSSTASPRSRQAAAHDPAPERDHPRHSSARDQQSLRDLEKSRQEDWMQEQMEEARRANTRLPRELAPKRRVAAPAVSPPQLPPQAPAPSTLTLPPWLKKTDGAAPAAAAEPAPASPKEKPAFMIPKIMREETI